MKLNRYVFAAAKLATAAFVVWVAVGVVSSLGYGLALQIVAGVGVGALLALWSLAAELAVREARDKVAAIVAHELARRDSDASVTALADAVAAPSAGRHRLDDTARIELYEDTEPALFTHDQLLGAYRHDELPFTDVTESAPHALYTKGSDQ